MWRLCPGRQLNPQKALRMHRSGRRRPPKKHQSQITNQPQQQLHQQTKKEGRTIKNLLLTSIAAGALASAALALPEIAAAACRPVDRRCHGEPAARARLPGHREPRLMIRRSYRGAADWRPFFMRSCAGGENGDRVSVQFGQDDHSSRDGESNRLPEARTSGQSRSVEVSLSPFVIRREPNGSVSAERAGADQVFDRASTPQRATIVLTPVTRITNDIRR